MLPSTALGLSDGFPHAGAVPPMALSRTAPPLPFAQIFCVVLALVLLLSPSSAGHGDAEAMVWLTTATLGAFTFHAVRTARRSGQNVWLAPAPLITMYFFLRYGIGALTYYYCEYFPWRAYPHLRWSSHRDGVWENLALTCQLVLLFACGMYIGLRSRTDRLIRSWPDLRWNIAPGKLKTSVVLYAPFAVGILTYVRSKQDEEGSLLFFLTVFGLLLYPIIVLASYWFFTAQTHAVRLRWGLFLLLVYVLVLPGAMRSGQMNPLLMPAVMIAVGRILAVGSPPWRLLLVLAPVLLCIVLPLTAYYKQSRLPGRSLEERVDLAYQQFKIADTTTRLELTAERTLLRFSGVKFPAVFSQYYPNVYPFQWGRTFGLELASLVPRVLWPDKPSASRELNLYSVGVRILKEGDGSAVLDAISEYYINFGAFGMFVFAILHGFYWKVMHDWLACRLHYVLGISMFVSLFLMNEDFFGIGQSFMTQVKILPIWILLLYLFGKRSRSAVSGI